MESSSRSTDGVDNNISLILKEYFLPLAVDVGAFSIRVVLFTLPNAGPNLKFDMSMGGIVFCQGGKQTYIPWYAQELPSRDEHVRVVTLSLAANLASSRTQTVSPSIRKFAE